MSKKKEESKIDQILEEMDDYSDENSDILKEFMGSEPNSKDDNLDGDESSDEKDFDFDFDSQKNFNNEREEQDLDAAEYLKNFQIEDEDLKEVTLSDYNIQEDVVLNDFKRKFPFKKLLIAVFFAVIIFSGIVAISFFNNYNIINNNIKNSVWTNGKFSVITKNYIVELSDLEYGQTVMYLTNTGDFIKSYEYATIIDEKFKSPRAIKCLDNRTGETITISLENISFIVNISEDNEFEYININ